MNHSKAAGSTVWKLLITVKSGMSACHDHRSKYQHEADEMTSPANDDVHASSHCGTGPTKGLPVGASSHAGWVICLG